MGRDKSFQPPQVMGRSRKMLGLFREIKKVASKEEVVLVTGEPGTYKELVARSIHYNSPRTDGPFVGVNLSSIPEELKEAEVFGYKKDHGPNRNGKLEQADNGTFFLAEITDSSTNFQERVLRFLKTEAAPGEEVANVPNVKFICSSSKILKKPVTNGDFHEGLYEVINKVIIEIPPLRERKDDIQFLGGLFLKEASERFDTGPKEFSKEARDFMAKYEWPGNMRELESTVKKAAILSNGSVIHRKDLMIDDLACFSMSEFLEEKLKRYLREMTKLENCHLHETVMSEVEKSLITIVLKETSGNQLKTAKTLGINRNTLRSKIKEYKIRV
ncbi:MAG TPA: sigma 54-interacting transcriptional regulator [Thermodesulfovibrionales bacterium]|nr:sigma 54-interacting transcriptional regulator [Thermodesulfovibrionales bacterium]